MVDCCLSVVCLDGWKETVVFVWFYGCVLKPLVDMALHFVDAEQEHSFFLICNQQRKKIINILGHTFFLSIFYQKTIT